MGTARRITSNFLSLAIAEVVSKAIQLIIFIYIARVFGKSEFGKFGFALAFATISLVIVDFGINTSLIREISRNKKGVKKYVSNALIIKAFLSSITFLVASIFLKIGGYTDSIRIITYLMLLFVVLQSFTDLFYSVFRAFERMHYDSLIKVLRMFSLSTLVFIVIMNKASITIVTLMFPITEIFVLIVSSIIYIKKFTKISLKLDVEFSKDILKISIPFWLSIISSSLIFVGVVILEDIRGSTEVGIYTAAFNLLLGLTYIPLMFSTAIFPVFSRYFVKDKPLLKLAYKKSFQYMLILGLPITIGLYVYAKDIILLVYGSNYFDSIIAIKILSWIVLLRFVNITSGTTLSSINRQVSRVFSQATGGILNLLFSILLIPNLGFVGLCIALIISESCTGLMYNYFIIKHGLKIEFIKSSAKPIIATIFMTLIIINIPNLFLGFIFGIISYIIILFILKTFEGDDKEILRRIIMNN